MTATPKAGPTPGPWHVYHALLRPQFPGSKIIEVQDADGQAVVQWAGFDNCDRFKKTHLANARLIAAAPELLEAAQLLETAEDLRDDCDDCEECEGSGEPEACGTCFPLFDEARVKRRAAIAKATGEQP